MHLLQAQVSNVIASPFLAFPPGSSSGTIAKSDNSVINDEEFEKLKEAKMTFGGAEVEWARMTGEFLPQLRTCSYIDHFRLQRRSTEISGTPEHASRASRLLRL